MEIIVIGPEHPCIRCITTFKFAKEIAGEFPGKIEARKIFTNSEEAKKYGKAEGGYEISQIEKVEHDEEGIKRLNQEIDELKTDEEKNWSLIEAKMQEIQEKLKPISKKSEEKGYLMTPVLVINGQVKASGYVPNKEKIREWVRSELR
jgi:uncharacterized protein (UPF0297 family)